MYVCTYVNTVNVLMGTCRDVHAYVRSVYYVCMCVCSYWCIRPPCVDDKAVVETFQKVGRFQDTLANRAVFEVKKK